MPGVAPLPHVDTPTWDEIPSELAERPQWLLWRFEQNARKPKPDKVPYYLQGGRRTGDQGSDRDRGRLATLDQVRARFERDADAWAGVGFAFLPGDGLIGIDIDGAIDPGTGEVSERCTAIVQACASYTEYSPSGKGVHIICTGTTSTNKSNDIGLEIFSEGQYFTFTGRRWPGSPPDVEAIDDGVLRRLHKTVDDAKEARRAQQRADKPAKGATSRAQPAAGGGDAFARVNDAARQSIEAWVPQLFPKARGGGKGYRLTSKQLGRNLQEDLQIFPGGDGIYDFGEERAYSPIDIVMQYLPANTPALALAWLAPLVGVALDEPRKKKPRVTPAPAREGQGADGPPPDGDGGPSPDSDAGADEARLDLLADRLVMARGSPMDCRENVLYCLELDPVLAGLVRLNDFTHIFERSRPAPWGREQGDWDEEDDLMLGEYLLRRHGLGVKSKGTLRDGVLMAARLCRYNPIADKIRAEPWDATPRLEHWLPDVFEVVDRPYTRLIGKMFFMGLVKRALEPGCKFDYMLLLKGEQGLAKSGAFRAIAYPYFTDNAIRVGDKDSQMAQQLAWIVESAELESLNKSETTAIKQHLSAQEDWYRPPYGSSIKKAPRHSVSVGTTNADTFLKDATGDRRMWPLEVPVVHLEVLRAMVPQLLAEALHYVERGERYWPSRQEEKEIVFPEHEPFKRGDPWEAYLDEYVNAEIEDPAQGRKRREREFFPTTELYDKALQVKADRIDGNGQMDTRLGNAMKLLGFVRLREPGRRRLRGWQRVAAQAAPAVATVAGPAPAQTFAPDDDGGADDLPF